MRRCAKMRCEEEAASSVAVRYGDRTVVIRDLALEHDPALLDLCGGHADTLTPPINWRMVDERRPVLQGSVEGTQA